jgi:hypothetical protein
MFTDEELKILEQGLHLVRIDSIKQIDWAQNEPVPPPGYEQEHRQKLKQIKSLIQRLREMTCPTSP